MIVDVGAKRDGVIPHKDLELLDESYRESLSIGDRVPVVVLGPWGNGEGLPVSINKGLQQQDWLHARDLAESEQVVEAPIVDINRGGVLVQFGGLRGIGMAMSMAFQQDGIA
jgi:ribosomal protein S1